MAAAALAVVLDFLGVGSSTSVATLSDPIAGIPRSAVDAFFTSCAASLVLAGCSLFLNHPLDTPGATLLSMTLRSLIIT